MARSLVDALGSDCGIASALARMVAPRQSGIIDSHSLNVGPAPVVMRVTSDFAKRGWLSPTKAGWRIGPTVMPPAVPGFLEGAAAMRRSLGDGGNALAIVTLPLAPSAIERALPLTGFAHASLLSTADALKRVAAVAVGSMTVMTPFLNEDGLDVVLDLFRDTRASTRRLIVRQLGGAKDLVTNNSAEISALRIKVLDYTLPAGDGFETGKVVSTKVGWGRFDGKGSRVAPALAGLAFFALVPDLPDEAAHQNGQDCCCPRSPARHASKRKSTHRRRESAS